MLQMSAHYNVAPCPNGAVNPVGRHAALQGMQIPSETDTELTEIRAPKRDFLKTSVLLLICRKPVARGQDTLAACASIVPHPQTTGGSRKILEDMFLNHGPCADPC